MKLKRIYGVVLILILLILTFNSVVALEISNVRTEDIIHNSALVKWTTDEPTDSFVNFGTDKNNLRTLGNAAKVIQHQMELINLVPETDYFFSVESDLVVDDNGGELYQFATTEPDTDAPDLNVEIPERISGTTFDISGTTESGAEVTLFIDDRQYGVIISNSEGNFGFSDVQLNENRLNSIKIESKDRFGNTATFTGTIFSDTKKPRLTLNELPNLTEENSIELKGTFSEQVSYEISVNEKSAGEGEGESLEETINLDEGINKIEITFTDLAGLQSTERFQVESDTQPPHVTIKVEKGTEYYEGRAESDITGETEPGAEVYLYIYKPQGYEFNPDFKRARKKVTADEEGKFKFNNVDFEGSILDLSIDILKPKEVPSGLQQTTIFPIQAVAEQEQFTYYVYVIAEDKTGKTAYAPETRISIHTCFSQNLDFSPESLPQFQAPLRLIPSLMDQGQQEVQAVYKFNYLGQGVPKLGPDGSEIERGFKIHRVDFEPACTKGMAEDKFVGMGCKVLPRAHKSILSPDGSNVYVTWNLRSTGDFSERQDDFWDDFVDRQVVFPLKMRIQYQEKNENNQWSETKFQTACTHLGYSVDIPLESKEMVPDWLADEGVDALNATIDAIQWVRPKIETAYYVSGFTCMGSFLGRFVARTIRIITSKFESYYGWIKKGFHKASGSDDEKMKACPPTSVQHEKLYLKSTLENLLKLNRGELPEHLEGFRSITDPGIEEFILEERCPSTASAWKFENAVDQAYKWSCDRAFCRKAPAKWTETKEVDEIQEAIVKQNQCSVTARGVPLTKRENCQELIKTNQVNIPGYVTIDGTSTCWQTADNQLYIRKPDRELSPREKDDTKRGIYRLVPIGPLFQNLEPAVDDLIAFKPGDSEGFFVARDATCESVCKQKKGYKAAETTDGNGCYDETVVEGARKLFDNGVELNSKEEVSKKGTRYAAGYTRECFLKREADKVQLQYDDRGEPIMQQCVCQGPVDGETVLAKGVRESVKKEEGKETEKWSYRQERIFKESKRTKGTYYPPERYISGRDVSAAFGQNHLLDYIRGDGSEEIPTIDPHSQYAGMVQSACFSSILKNLKMLESILTGVRNCILEAKHTGIQDAGMCKTIFTQHVCGLFYRGIAYFVNGCHPKTFDDVGKEGTFGDLPVLLEGGFESMAESLDSSVSDIQDDYGNAQLNEFFRAGGQGLAQSMCMWALGAEFPLFSKDFLMDAAYAVPTKTSAFVFPREREFSTFNPARQTAIHTYKIGGSILPGCKIRQAKMSLKCIGPEDQGHPDLDLSCDGRGCDCLNAERTDPAYGQRTRLLGNWFDLPVAEQFSIPLPPFEKVDSHYRYDHVLLELFLDPLEESNREACFDQGYIDGKFYYPIKDVGPTAVGSCRVDLVTGRYVCPELASLFGTGKASFESPFVQCWNKHTGTWMDCSSPNLFVLNDDIKTRVHMNLDQGGKCLKRTVHNVPGIPEELKPYRTVPEGTPGPLAMEDTLGRVGSTMFGTESNTIERTRDSNVRCGIPILSSSNTVKHGLYEFRIIPENSGNVKVRLSTDVDVLTSGYVNDGGNLKKGTTTSFPISEVNNIEFNVGGYKIKKIFDRVSTSDSNKICAYEVKAKSSIASRANERKIQVTYELYERDEAGTCTFANQPVQGARHSVDIRIQKESITLTAVNELHNSFMSGNYEQTQTQALNIINNLEGDLNHALAVYYYTATFIMQGKKENNPQRYSVQINNLLNLFFDRKWAGQKVAGWDAGVLSSPEHKKINAYMCEIDKKFEGGHCNE